MCTWSVISLGPGRGFRVMMNRDEERTRAPALPPRRHELGEGVRAMWPVDLGGGGTWIAASETGLVCAILNGNPAAPQARPVNEVSRGVLIPSLMHHASASAAVAQVRARDLLVHRPFRMVAVDRDGGEREGGAVRVTDLVWTGTEAVVSERWCRAACFTSSGLGDERVAGRLHLFDAMVGQLALVAGPDSAALDAAQRAFHAHRWPGQDAVSVMMHRADARTMSVASVMVPGADGPVRMDYEAVPDPTGQRR